ncbi:MAG: hypothetical protein CSB33_03590 [Desulfobacterales bacterium]|nr:MAG: hypothetical protein CSB33_03590 [Desulfobacterales bacterium]
MKERLLKTYMAVLLVLAFAVPAASADDSELIRLETLLMEQINQCRANPLETAESIGFSGERLLADLPELREILTDGLPPLTLDSRLRDAARSHAAGELAVINADSPPADEAGVSLNERLEEYGYFPQASGESVGMLAFANFISPELAVSHIFERMLREELSPEPAARRNILAADVSDIGIGFVAGAVNILDGQYNAYLASCFFAGSALTTLQSSLLHRINMARKAPLDLIASLGLGLEESLSEELENGLPSLTMNPDLHAAAGSHAANMAGNDCYGHISPDGAGYEERIRMQGYEASATGEVLSISCYINGQDDTLEMEAAAMLEDILIDELLSRREKKLFRSDFSDVGIGLVAAADSPLAGICGDGVYLMVITLGSPLEVSLDIEG